MLPNHDYLPHVNHPTTEQVLFLRLMEWNNDSGINVSQIQHGRTEALSRGFSRAKSFVHAFKCDSVAQPMNCLLNISHLIDYLTAAQRYRFEGR